jgi:hypothetical protein
MKRSSLAVGIAWLVMLAGDVRLNAQETTSIENGPDGVTYRVTHRVSQRSIPTTELQTREQKSYRPQVTTEYQSYPQTYVAPVTEYQWVARYRGWWNPFVQPYWSHELVPVTRWEARPGSVQVPVARTNWIEETRITQVPVTTYRTVQDESTSRVAISAAPGSTGALAGSSGATGVALRPIGGQQMQSDPPRDGTATGTYRR